VTTSWFFLSTLNYDARSTTRQVIIIYHVTWKKTVWISLINFVIIR